MDNRTIIPEVLLLCIGGILLVGITVATIAWTTVLPVVGLLYFLGYLN